MEKDDHLIEVPISLIRKSYAFFNKYAPRYSRTEEGDERYQLSFDHRQWLDKNGG